MVGGTEELRQALVRTSEANIRLRVQLESNERLMRSLIVLIDEGMPVFTALGTMNWVPERDASDAAIRDLYEERKALRDLAVVTALAEGRSVSEIAQAFGLRHDQIVGHVGDDPNRGGSAPE